MSDESRTDVVPLAEHFHSIQGEGHWVGTPMHFIRVSGCCVGSSATLTFIDQYPQEKIPILSDNVRASKCRTYDGRFFTCDTNFHLIKKMSVEDLLKETYEYHICLTGGEPIAYQHQRWFKRLFYKAAERSIQIHIETSGTINLDSDYCGDSGVWLTVAPKFGVTDFMLAQADEIKILVDENFSWDTLPAVVKEMYEGVYLCSINDEKVVDRKNIDRCIELLKEKPGWKLGVQLHKMLELR